GNIPLVANHLSASAARVNGNRKRWLVMASFCVAAGFSLVIAGALLLRNPEQIYNYVSDSIIPMGANGEVFTTLEEYVEYAVAPLQLELVDADISPAERHERITRETERINYSLAPLKFHHFLSSPQSRGRYFTDELTDMADWDVLVAAGINTGGTRTYASEGSTPIDGSMPVWLAIAGSFLALWGMLAFMIAAPLFKRNN
ncbi:MAG: hypothetical protein RL120_01280, partial [Gammaproteobacteria bacterium]